MPGSAASNNIRISLEEEDEEPYKPKPKEIDTNYSDPLGPMPERPKTSGGRGHNLDDEFADEEIGDDLLPE